MRLLVSLVVLLLASPVRAALTVERTADGARLRTDSGVLELTFVTPGIVRVRHAAVPPPPYESYVVLKKDRPAPPFRMEDTAQAVTLRTDRLQVRVDKQTGALAFLDAKGAPLLREPPKGGRTLTPATVNGEKTAHGRQTFALPADEAIYGLGQYQDGYFDRRHVPTRLKQYNLQIALPTLLSTRGYGLLWENASVTDVNVGTTEVALAGKVEGKPPRFTGTGTFRAATAGLYGLHLNGGPFAGGDNFRDVQSLEVNGKVANRIDNHWVVGDHAAVVRLAAGTHTVKVASGRTEPRLFVRPPSNDLVIASEAAPVIAYYFIHGTPDEMIAGYRELTGQAPMFPRWAFGFWQCRERYSTQDQLLGAAAEFRRRKIPVDVIVQDWQYWGKYGWNAMRFDEAFYPDPAAMIRKLHDQHLKLVISVWMKEGPDGGAGYRVPGTPWIDIYSKENQKRYWAMEKKGLYDLGVDGWWQDATEPEGDPLAGKQVSAGNAHIVRNAYPLFANQAVYEGQRAANADKRVVILTRSAWAGQQRYGAASWSGDIGGDWDAYRRQIPAGLNFAMAGIPYWTTDIGGFFRPRETQYETDDYRELLTRWIQYGTFTPLYRIHGYQSFTEIWKFGMEAEANMVKMTKLRYRLLPYIYSQAWRVTNEGYTMMRGLPMDFPGDRQTRAVGDQFMFGPAFLVSPVTAPKARTRRVYLPAGAAWIDFWSGERVPGGRAVNAPAPLDRLPLHVRAGSVVPLGPELQYATEKPVDPLEVRIYPGADGRTVVYEDQNDGYAYEKGQRATFELVWDDRGRTLQIGARQGSFPGMIGERTVHMVLVRPGHGTGGDPAATPDKTVRYTGQPLRVGLE